MRRRPDRTRRRAVRVNDKGLVIGEDHHRSTLTDHDVHLILTLRDERMALREIAAKFECSVSTVESICLGRRRGQTAVGQRRLAPHPAKRRTRT